MTKILIEKIKLKCGNCGTEGEEKMFEKDGIKECPWCNSDIWLDTLKNHNEANEMTNNNLLSSKDILNVGWKVKMPDFTTFEFTTNEDVESDEDYEFDLMRLFLNKDGTSYICIANTEDYDVHEEVTNKFDVDNIVEYLLSQISDIEDVTKMYIEHYAERKANGEDLD